MQRPHVLIVEDSDLVSSALRLLFEETGHDVSVAAGIAEAVSAAESRRVDVMLLDLTLADGHGLDALGVLREHGVLPRSILAMTGRDEPEVVAQCMAAGCSGVLVKPVPINDLLARVREALL
jgi:DNA-binding response OmpR family regulator